MSAASRNSLRKTTDIQIRNVKQLVNKTQKCCKVGEQETFHGWIDPSEQIEAYMGRK
jgi:hypothetical protein